MILDTSAVLSIVFREQGFQSLVDKIIAADLVGIGTPTLSETGGLLIAKLGPEGRGILERFLDEFSIVLVPFGEQHWRTALDAFTRFGKGRHRASLNLGDCLTYATAKLAGAPLLYVGEQFSCTDIEAA
ncbi:MAG: type II toxin-antitoxin system VapC family toxin [Gemmatimonadetes bacterium]|nr:type II toxin-antitoxin system VapC family toxin [Gemmatimonadota bacterium]